MNKDKYHRQMISMVLRQELREKPSVERKEKLIGLDLSDLTCSVFLGPSCWDGNGFE